MDKYQILDDVNKVSIQLMLNETFYGHFFNKLVRDTVDNEHRCNTACVSLNSSTNMLSLLINEEFWSKGLCYDKNGNKYDDEKIKNFKYGVIKHEILHILFKDLFSYHKFTDKRLGNMAVDLRVNQYIDHKYLPMLEDICILENFPHFFPDPKGADAGQTSMYYYGILSKELDKVSDILSKGKQKSKSGQGQGQGQPQSGNGSDQGQDQSDEGQDGNGDGDGDNESKDGNGGDNQSDQKGQGNDPRNNSNWDQLNSSQKKLAQFIDSEANQRMHATWGELSNLKDGQKEFIENWTNSMVNESVKTCDSKKPGWRGTMPAGLMQYLESIIDNLTPSVNWKKVLREFAQNGENSHVESTLKRRSKRFGTYPGHRIVTTSRIMVAIDTSGSVCNESLAEFFAEVHNIWKNEVEIRIVECDASIPENGIWDYKGVPPTTVTGRGGTDFNPPIIYANEEYKPDALIYFTDGECSVPVHCNCPIMWLLSKNQGAQVENMNDFQGIKVKMDF